MRRFLAWQQSRDFLKELQVLVLLGLAGVLFVIGFGIADLLTGGPIVTHLLVEPTEVTPASALPSGVTAYPIDELTVEIAHPTARQRVMHWLTQGPTAVIAVIFLALLARIIHRARRSDPFTARTVRGLRWLGVVLWLGVIAVPVEAWAQSLLSQTINPDRLAASFDLPLVWLFGGFLCFAVAEVVQRGRTLREELETVI